MNFVRERLMGRILHQFGEISWRSDQFSLNPAVVGHLKSAGFCDQPQDMGRFGKFITGSKESRVTVAEKSSVPDGDGKGKGGWKSRRTVPCFMAAER